MRHDKNEMNLLINLEQIQLKDARHLSTAVVEKREKTL